MTGRHVGALGDTLHWLRSMIRKSRISLDRLRRQAGADLQGSPIAASASQVEVLPLAILMRHLAPRPYAATQLGRDYLPHKRLYTLGR
jgi:hypothetical protein